MELNFDKEMDAILRQAARSGETMSVNSLEAHLDADEIASFAENALPEKTRTVYIKHFADCNRCRTILSNTILLNREAGFETASSAVPVAAPEIVETEIPWYRKIFAVRNLAYTMGALVVLFGGFIGFLVYQSANNFQNSEISKVSDSEPATSSPNFETGAAATNSNAASVSNTANTSSNTMMSNTSVYTFNSSANLNPSNSAANTAVPAPTPEVSAKESRVGRNQLVEQPTVTQPQTEAAKNEEEKAALKNEASSQSADATTAAGAPAKPAPPAPVSKKLEEQNKLKARTSVNENNAKSDAESVSTRRNVGGRTFNRRDGVWYDANFRGQNTKNIRRNTDEYRKLDKELRIIAESLDGTVVVVWKDKTYRIQ